MKDEERQVAPSLLGLFVAAHGSVPLFVYGTALPTVGVTWNKPEHF
jgi:cytochrome c2